MWVANSTNRTCRLQVSGSAMCAIPHSFMKVKTCRRRKHAPNDLPALSLQQQQWPSQYQNARPLLVTSAATSTSSMHRSATNSQSNSDGSVDLRTASMLLLLAESFKRATGRPLISSDDLLQVPALIQDLSCAVLLAEPQQATSQSGHSTHVITYANGPARTLLLASQGISSGVSLDQVLEQPLPDKDLQYPHLAPGQAPSWRWSRGCRFKVHAPQSSQPIDDEQHTGSAQPIAVADCVVCDVASPTGKVISKALLWDRWVFPADGRVGRPGVPAIHPSNAPSQSELDAALLSVRDQADHVKALKTSGGKTNQDVEVQQAVAQLQAFKHSAAQLQLLRSVYVLDEVKSPLRELIVAESDHQEGS